MFTVNHFSGCHGLGKYNVQYDVVDITLKRLYVKFKPGICPLLSSKIVYLHLKLLLFSCSFPLQHMQENMYLFDIHMTCYCNHPSSILPTNFGLPLAVCLFPQITTYHLLLVGSVWVVMSTAVFWLLKDILQIFVFVASSFCYWFCRVFDYL